MADSVQAVQLTQETVRVRCVLLAERIEVRPLASGSSVAVTPLTLMQGEAGYVVLLRYGVAVFFNLGPDEETAFIRELSPMLRDPLEPLEELFEIRVRPGEWEGVREGAIYLKVLRVEHLQLIAELLARSVVLDHYEARVARNFETVEPLAEHLRSKGPKAARNRELLRHIGEVLINQMAMVGRVEVREKPELLWYHPELEGLYVRLEDEFEISERHLALERKLTLMARTAETVLDILQTKRTLRVEWYIVILIVVEIILTLYEMFIRG